MIKEENMDLKNMFKGLKVLVLYLFMSVLSYILLALFGINLDKLNIIIKQIYLILFESGIIFIITLMYKEEFISNFKDFKKNWFTYLKKYTKCWIVALILMILSTLVISIFTKTFESENQKIIIDQIHKMPLYTFIMIVILSPIIEELVFRLSFKKIFPHTKFLFIFFSGLFFGFIHVIGNLENIINLLYIIPYSIPGFIFAYIYDKSNNICIPISLHIIHNIFMMIIQIILIII